VWEWTVQEWYFARLCHWANCQFVRKTTKNVKSWWKLLLMAPDVEWTIHWNVCQRRVNNLFFCIYGNYTVIWLLLCITDVLAACIGKWGSNTVTTPFWEWASTERQQLVVLYVRLLNSDFVTILPIRRVGSIYWLRRQQHCHGPILRMSDNGGSRICGCVSMVITQ